MGILKLVVLFAGKWLGLFYVSRRLTRKALRILCYHGIEMDDESNFRPSLFMSEAKFNKRMEYLSRHKYQILELGTAIDLLKSDRLPHSGVVLTFDDGWYGIYEKAVNTLHKKGFPVTVYVTSYYCVKREPIFVLLVQYMFWKTSVECIELTDIHAGLNRHVDLSVPVEREHAINDIIRLHDSVDEEGRSELVENMCKCMRLSCEYIQDKHIMYLMSPVQVEQIAKQGVDIQLHTHRHRFSEDSDLARKEIVDNKKVLEPLLGKELTHFCYPSGFWRKDLWGMLESLGIRTATTCDSGFNFKHTPELALNRFLDGEHIKQIQFEAEVSGFNEILRAGRRLFN